MGDSIGAGIVYHLSKDDLESMDTDGDLGKELDVLSETSKHGGKINEGLDELSEKLSERL